MFLKLNGVTGESKDKVHTKEIDVLSWSWTNCGTALALGWSRLSDRPEADLRQAIRAYLLVSIYNGDVSALNAKTEAIRVKSNGQDWFDRETATRLRRYLCLEEPINTKAVRYLLQAKGSGTVRATAVCEVLNSRVEDQMYERCYSGDRLAVVLIDMQDDGVGQDRFYGGRTILEHQQAVLTAAGELNVVIYDIVIDAAGAKEVGSAKELEALRPIEKESILERQRRASYADKAQIKTISALRDYYKPGTPVRHIPKPSHPTFMGTLFAEHLASDRIDTAMVMGYDANQYIKATVFGAPAYKGTSYSTDYTEGLLDRNIKVITSRAVMASSYSPLDSEWGKISSNR
ncbi:MAG: type VI secretion system tube protein Hcp [Chthoniobacterales bacterium]